MNTTKRFVVRHSHVMAGLLLAVVAGACYSPVHADPGDFQTMPGLWKITLHNVAHGRAAHVQVKWKCLYDGGDPWATFVDAMAPDASCRRSNEHRASTALAWQIHCGTRSGHGHIALDSPQHYTGEVVLNGHDVLQVEGVRAAACTSPSD